MDMTKFQPELLQEIDIILLQLFQKARTECRYTNKALWNVSTYALVAEKFNKVEKIIQLGINYADKHDVWERMKSIQDLLRKSKCTSKLTNEETQRYDALKTMINDLPLIVVPKSCARESTPFAHNMPSPDYSTYAHNRPSPSANNRSSHCYTPPAYGPFSTPVMERFNTSSAFNVQLPSDMPCPSNSVPHGFSAGQSISNPSLGKAEGSVASVHMEDLDSKCWSILGQLKYPMDVQVFLMMRMTMAEKKIMSTALAQAWPTLAKNMDNECRK